MFISAEDLAIANEYSEAGYIIRPNAASDAFLWIQKQTALIAANALKLEEPKQVEKFLKYIALIFELRCFHPLSINNLARKREHPWTN